MNVYSNVDCHHSSASEHTSSNKSYVCDLPKESLYFWCLIESRTWLFSNLENSKKNGIRFNHDQRLSKILYI